MYNKIACVELNSKSPTFSDLTCLFDNGLSLVASKDSLIKHLNLCHLIRDGKFIKGTHVT